MPAMLALAAICWIQTGGNQASAADPVDQARAHAAAGEFGPALQQAEQVTGAARDALLADIARGQARAGGHHAALATVRGISRPQDRNQTAQALLEEPISGPARGGGPEPDFESLIELITTTIEPTTWDDVGGPGAISEYAGGVYVDALGLMQPRLLDDQGSALARLRARAARPLANATVRQSATLRKVSLPRLEREIALRLAAGEPLDPEMLVLAGMERVEYVLVYPENGDIVLAGPAGDWQTVAEGRVVRVDNGRPVLHLVDLVVMLRQMLNEKDARFGCSITPTKESLARVQAFVQQSSTKPLKAGGREKWLKELRAQLGPQDLGVFGISPRTRAAQVLLEADYRMKRVGIGLEPGVLGVESYLDRIRVAKGQSPPMNVLRWYFTMNYEGVRTTTDRNAFEFLGQGVKVLSENELLDATGGRVHTGFSDEATAGFAADFTSHFAALAEKYPVYGELRNVFDLALVASLIRGQNLTEQSGWQPTCWLDESQFPCEQGPLPQTVETVMNHRVFHKTQIVAVISGGVHANPAELVQSQALKQVSDQRLPSTHHAGRPAGLEPAAWWWD